MASPRYANRALRDTAFPRGRCPAIVSSNEVGSDRFFT